MEKEKKVRKQRIMTPGLPMTIVQGVESGVRRTIKEWAEKEGRSYSNVMVSLTGLRKRGFNYHPYPEEILVKGKRKTGILVDIMKNQDYLTTGMNTYGDNHSIPHFKGMLRIIEAGIEKHPALMNQLQGWIDDMQVQIVQSRKRLFGNKSKLL